MERISVVVILVTSLILTCFSFVWGAEDRIIDDIYILSDIDRGQIEIRILPREGNLKRFQDATVDVCVHYPDGSIKKFNGIKLINIETQGIASLQLVLNIDPVILWHPKTPNLYLVDLFFYNKHGSLLTSAIERFGMRKFESREGRFYINNKPFYVRACGHEKENIFGNLNREASLKRLKQLKRYGFNTVRHHSHMPSEMYLKVADEIGVLIQMEIGGKIGTDPESERFIQSKNDWINMIKQGRHHPCTFIYSMGNEIYTNEPGLIRCQDILYDLAKEMDPGVLVLNRSGSNPFNDAFGKYDLIERPIGEYEHIAKFTNEAFLFYLRGDGKGQSDKFPILAHEYPLVASFPNIELSAKYDEEPFWLKETRENAKRNNLEHLLPEFVKNSEKIQAICRKEMLEEARKFPELDGYSMLRFTDNEEKVSGVVDDFSDPKNVTAEEFLRTNGETVLLCTWNERCFRYGDTLEATLEISHHGSEPYSAPKCQWWLMNGAKVLTEGAFDNVNVGAVNVAEIGKIKVVVPTLHKPAKLTLLAALSNTRPYINNTWYFWAFPTDTLKPEIQSKILIWDPRKRLKTYLDVYPQMNYINDENWNVIESKASLIITDSWQESFYKYLAEGGNLWIISDKSWHWPEEMGIFGLHITKFIPAAQAPVVFPELDELCTKWLTICSNSKSRYGNSGTIIYPHPALDNFPNEGFCDIQFWPMIYRAKSLQLDRFPKGTEPLIRTIDNFYRCQNKGYMVELGVGKGKVFVSTLNLTQSFPWSVATRYMFDQLLCYLTDSERYPSVNMTSEELRKMIEDFAKEIKTREPLISDEMPARYTTRWKWLLNPNELIILPIYEAKGVDENRLAVHWEYAQTQWYLNAKPLDKLLWEFENKTDGDFTCSIYLASPLKGITFYIQPDDRELQKVEFQGSDGWERFVPVEIPITKVKAGKHTLTISLPEDAATKDGQTLQIRDIELRAKSSTRDL